MAKLAREVNDKVSSASSEAAPSSVVNLLEAKVNGS
jgi:hypothetical protein